MHKETIGSLSSSVSIETFTEPAKTFSYPEETVQKNAPGSNTLDQYVQQYQIRNAEWGSKSCHE